MSPLRLIRTAISAGRTAISARRTAISAGRTAISAGRTAISAGRTALAASAMILATVPAFAQTTDIIIDTDGVVQLRCLDPLAFDISVDELSAALGVTDNAGIRLSGGSQTTTASGSTLVVSMPTMNVPLAGNVSGYRLTGVGCAITTAASFSRDVTVTVSLPQPAVLRGTGSSTITVNSVLARRSGTTSAFSSSYRYWSLFHIFGDTLIEFQVTADLSRASAAGLHSSPVPGTFTVTVTSE